MKLSEILIKYRKDHDLSQRQFSAVCGLSNGYISMIEKGINPKTGERITPTLVALQKMAMGMRMTLDELLALADDMDVDISVKGNSLRQDEMELLDLYNEVDPDVQDAILSLVRTIRDAVVK